MPFHRKPTPPYCTACRYPWNTKRVYTRSPGGKGYQPIGWQCPGCHKVTLDAGLNPGGKGYQPIDWQCPGCHKVPLDAEVA